MQNNFELIAFYTVFVGLILVSGFVPQSILEDWDITILLFIVLPFLAWGGRLILKGKIE